MSFTGALSPAGEQEMASAQMPRTTTSAAPAPPVLARLIGDQPPERFFAERWERNPTLCRGAFASASALVTFDQLEVLAASAMGEASGRLHVVDKIARPLGTSSDEATAVASVFRSYHAGNTLLLTELQRHWGPIAQLCRALEGELLELGVRLAQRVGANAYLTPARSRGFEFHYDDHCVFIVQLTGAKQWQVYAPRVELPLDRCTAPIPAEQLGPAILEAELRPGDVLYIPRGFPHAARTGDESSLHLTISLHALTWWSVLQEALRSKPELRRSVPRSFGEGGAQVYFDSTLHAALAVGDIQDRLERSTAQWIARLVPVPHGRIRAIDSLRFATLGPDTCVKRVEGALCVVHRDGDQVVMQIPGTALRLPAAMEEAFTFIARTPTFSPAELPLGRAIFDPIDLVRILVVEGLLEISSPTSGRTS